MLIENCCHDEQDVKSNGISMEQFVCIARCHGALARPIRAADTDVATFRQHVVAAVSTPSAPYLVASFSREVLGQTGDGHFSPIAGYDPQSDHILVLDVARFKYPPWYVPLELLFKAMRTTDPATGLSRGYAWVAASSAALQTTGARRDVPADGGGGGACPITSIRRAYCPVSPTHNGLPCTGRHTTRASISKCAVRLSREPAQGPTPSTERLAPEPAQLADEGGRCSR